MAKSFEFSLTEHVCQQCCGRMLESRNGGYRCSNCGLASAQLQCMCGVLVRGRDAGIRCVANDNRSIEWPSEFVAEEVPMQESLW